MDPSVPDAVQYNRSGHHEIQHEIGRMQFLQSFCLRQRPRESCDNAKIFTCIYSSSSSMRPSTCSLRHCLHLPSRSQFRSPSISISLLMNDIMTSSGTKLPLSRYFFTCLPISTNQTFFWRFANKRICLELSSSYVIILRSAGDEWQMWAWKIDSAKNSDSHASKLTIQRWIKVFLKLRNAEWEIMRRNTKSLLVTILRVKIFITRRSETCVWWKITKTENQFLELIFH